MLIPIELLGQEYEYVTRPSFVPISPYVFSKFVIDLFKNNYENKKKILTDNSPPPPLWKQNTVKENSNKIVP